MFLVQMVMYDDVFFCDVFLLEDGQGLEVFVD